MKKFLLTSFIIAIALIAHAQWSDNPGENNRITPPGVGIYDSEIQVSQTGTSFIAFNRPLGGNIVTFLQILDVEGNMLFPEEGMLISNKPSNTMTVLGNILFVDNDGNAIIIVTDYRNSSGENNSYSLYKVSPTGEMLWGANGVDLNAGASYELLACMNIVQLDDGSYVCSWMVMQGTDSYVQLQKISSSGTLLWNEEAVRIYESSTPNEWPLLVNAGDNNVIVVYSRGTSKNIRARKIDSNGAPVWANDVSIYNGPFGLSWVLVWHMFRVIPDQMGGAFVGWYDNRYSSGFECTYVSHVTSNGTLGFPSGENGEKVGYSGNRCFYPEMFLDKDEGFLYLTWRETNSLQSLQGINAQKLKISSCELMWGNNGKQVVPLSNKPTGFYSIQKGSSDNVAVFFTIGNSTSWDVNKVALLDGNGNFVWNNETIEFSNPVGWKANLLSTPLIFNNYWLTLWGDERLIAGYPSGIKKVYVQRINLDGSLGDNGAIFCLPPTNITVNDYNPGSAIINWEGESNDYELSYCVVDEEWLTKDVPGAHSFILENLLPATHYQVRVRSICAEDNVSAWSAIVSFTTPEVMVCAPPKNLNVFEITATGARFSWEEGNEDNDSWNFQYRKATDNFWLSRLLTEKSFFLDELIPNTTYQWAVSSNCLDETESEWTFGTTFTTDPVGISNIIKQSLIVYSDGKTLQINNQDNRFIERVQLYNVAGSLLGDYVVKSTDNVSIPINISEMMLLVKIVGPNMEETHKVFVR